MKECEYCGEYFHRTYFRFCYHCAARLLAEVQDIETVTDEQLEEVMEI